MNLTDRELLENILSGQVLCLAASLKAEALAKGVHSTSDYTSEARNLIKRKKEQILKALSA
jgi:hypothetical protein